jgi:hypothetical protein
MNYKIYSFLILLILSAMIIPADVNAKGLDSLETDSSAANNPGILLKVGKNLGLNLSKPQKEEGKTNEQAVAAPPKKFTKLKYSGYARAYILYRDMQQYYTDFSPGLAQGTSMPLNLTLGDGYQEPLFLIRLEGNPTPSTRFQIEYMFNNYLLRDIYNNSDPQGRYAALYRQFQFTAEKTTDYGRFKLISGGGVNWYSLSQYTLGSGGQYRDELFEKFPWEPEGHSFYRYTNFYASGNIPRDERWGNAATQGFILEASELPFGLNVAALYGKGTGSAGYQSYLTQRPMNLFGLRVKKNIRRLIVGYNLSNQFGYGTNRPTYAKVVDPAMPLDTFYIDKDRLSQFVTTFDGMLRFKNFNIYTEIGMGSYLSADYNEGLKNNAKPGLENLSNYKRNWDEVIYGEIDVRRGVAIPFKIAYYRVGPNVVNFGSSIFNSSIDRATVVQGQALSNATSYDGLVTDIGILTNNRHGLNLFFQKDLKMFITKLAIGATQEVVNQAGDIRNGARMDRLFPNSTDSAARVPYTNSITIQHHLNALTRSRFGFFTRFYGPYRDITSDYRRTFENITITDIEINYKKSFTTLDLELKYKFNLFKKPLILYSYTSYASVQENFSPIPYITSKAFVRNLYEEFMMFYNFHPKWTLVTYLGFEKVDGNSRTELADAEGNLITNANGRPIYRDDGKPTQQIGRGFGVGLDYDFQRRACLSIRSRWFDHKDYAFKQDVFKGHEMSFELKVFY